MAKNKATNQGESVAVESTTDDAARQTQIVDGVKAYIGNPIVKAFISQGKLDDAANLLVVVGFTTEIAAEIIDGIKTQIELDAKKKDITDYVANLGNKLKEVLPAKDDMDELIAKITMSIEFDSGQWNVKTGIVRLVGEVIPTSKRSRSRSGNGGRRKVVPPEPFKSWTEYLRQTYPDVYTEKVEGKSVNCAALLERMNDATFMAAKNAQT